MYKYSTQEKVSLHQLLGIYMFVQMEFFCLVFMLSSSEIWLVSWMFWLRTFPVPLDLTSLLRLPVISYSKITNSIAYYLCGIVFRNNIHLMKNRKNDGHPKIIVKIGPCRTAEIRQVPIKRRVFNRWKQSNKRSSTGPVELRVFDWTHIWQRAMSTGPSAQYWTWLSTGPCDRPYQTMGVRLAALNPPLHPSTRVIFGVEGARTTKCLIRLPSSRERYARLGGDAMPMTMQKRAATLEV